MTKMTLHVEMRACLLTDNVGKTCAPYNETGNWFMSSTICTGTLKMKNIRSIHWNLIVEIRWEYLFTSNTISIYINKN